MITIQKVSIEAIPVIKELAETTWADAYREILSPGQMQYMLAQIYSPLSLEEQMLKKGHRFILAVDDTTDQALGFASYSAKDPPEAGIYHLHKLYVLPSLQTKGTGSSLLHFVIEDSGSRGASLLTLNVNRHNKALGFYLRNGFEITDEVDIDIGNGYYMNDYIMTRKLTK